MNRADTIAQVTDLAHTIKVGTMRNTLRFQTLFQAEQAAAMMTQAGITCHWVGCNQAALTTAADFQPKGGE